MLNDWLSVMIILTSEVDILDSLNNDEIINRFAQKWSVYCNPQNPKFNEKITFCL